LENSIRTNEGVPFIPSAGAVVGVARESSRFDQPEGVLDDFLVIGEGCTEPGGVSGRLAREVLKVGVGVVGIILGARNSVADRHLVGKRATGELRPLVVNAGHSEVTREFECRNALNGGTEVLGGTIGVDVGEEARRFDGVLSCARPSEVVCRRD